MAKRKSDNIPKKYPFWLMVQNVTIKSMEVGQLPILIVGAIFILIFYRMPPEDITKILIRTRVSDYLVSIIISLLWFFHSRKQRSMYKNEIDRIAKKRDECQKLLIEKNIQSSED